ncbi:MAG: ribosome silencing factor [Sphingomonadales bacterium]|nr:ribosome silencing factor [Sphingomonadales bacterium]
MWGIITYFCTKLNKIVGKKQLQESALASVVLEGILEKKGRGVMQLDLRNITDRPADIFLIAEAESGVQVRAIADSVAERVWEILQVRPLGVEGKEHGQWILIDFGEVVVHVFQLECRRFYDLEDLWNDAVRTEHA